MSHDQPPWQVQATCTNCGASVILVGAEDAAPLAAQGWTDLERARLRPIFRGRCPKCSAEVSP